MVTPLVTAPAAKTMILGNRLRSTAKLETLANLIHPCKIRL
jgi:hypothetical protein